MSMSIFFKFPQKSKLGQIIPKSKIFEHAKLNSIQKKIFSESVKQIRWAYKLAPETVNLSATENIKEIQIIHVKLSKRDLSDKILHIIDSSIPSVVIFELYYSTKIKLKAAQKQFKDKYSTRTSLSSYFSSEWVDKDIFRSNLPNVISLGILYEKLLSQLVDPRTNIDEETEISLSDKVSNQEKIKAKEEDIIKLVNKLRSIKQYNKKLEINSILKKAKIDLEILRNSPTHLERKKHE